MIKKFFIFLICITLFFSLVSFVSAEIPGISVSIDIKDIYNPGELVRFNYSIISSDYIGNISYTPSIICNKSYQISPFVSDIDLNLGESYSSEYIYGIVDDDISSDICIANVYIEANGNDMIFEKSFEIIADKDLLIDVFFCKDKDCKEKSKTFVLGETVFINYISNTDSEVKGLLKKPKDTLENILLPYSFVSEKIGSYSLSVSSSKEGYKKYEREFMFGVIFSNFNIKEENYSLVLNNKTEIDKKEFVNYTENTTQDIKLSYITINKPEKSRLKYFLQIIFIILLIDVIIIIFVIYFLLKKRNKTKRKLNKSDKIDIIKR
jgi:hypothetical protein